MTALGFHIGERHQTTLGLPLGLVWRGFAENEVELLNQNGEISRLEALAAIPTPGLNREGTFDSPGLPPGGS